MKHVHLLTTVMTILVLEGCATAPSIEQVDSNPPTVRDIVSRIQCEVYTAATEHRSEFATTSKWAVVANLTLQVDQSGQLSPTLAFIDPLKAAVTSFTFGVGASLNGTSQRIYNETVTIYLDQLLNGSGPSPCTEGFRLRGDLKIKETVDAALSSTGDLLKPPPDGVKASNAFGETLQFIIVKNLNGVGPTWALKYFKGPVVSWAFLRPIPKS
jgi:hypothetical protein